MVEGRIRKFYEEVVLLEQVWVHDGESRVRAVLQKAGVTLLGFERFLLGEGVDKPQGPDFATRSGEDRGGVRRNSAGAFRPAPRRRERRSATADRGGGLPTARGQPS